MSKDQLVAKSADIMQGLESELGYTVGLGCLQPGSGYGIVLAAVDGTFGFSFHLEVGFEFPLHTGAPSKAMLAYMPEEERKEYLDVMDLQPFTASTIVSRADFESELTSIREQGYSLDVSEQIEGCHCVGVPVFDSEHRVEAGLWATAPSAQLPVRSFAPVAEVLRKGALEICSRLALSGRSMDRAYITGVVAQAQEIMKNNLHRTLNMEELAENLYVGYSWFRKNFRDKTGMSPAAYHQYLRMEMAKKLLKQPSMNVRQVAEQLGFKTQNHFSALFSRCIGRSPSAWRESLMDHECLPFPG